MFLVCLFINGTFPKSRISLPVLHVGIFDFALMVPIRSRYHGVTTGCCSWKEPNISFQNDSEMYHLFIRHFSGILYKKIKTKSSFILFCIKVMLRKEVVRVYIYTVPDVTEGIL